MTRKILSIVLPIYNVENYLEKCIHSILENKGSDKIEIILVDDGSTDGCPTICNEYAMKYNNIISYHKQNGGLSDARNFGLLKASSEYIWFVDSDDMISNNIIEKILNILEEKKPDVLIGDSIIIDENDEQIREPKFLYKHFGLKGNNVYSGKELIINQIKEYDYFQTTVWLGIYKRDFLIKNVLFFEVGLLHEDELWSPKVFLSTNNILYIDSDIYLYRIRNNSIMRNNKDNSKHVLSYIYIFSSLLSFYNWKISDKELSLKLEDNIAKRYLHSIISWEFVRYPNLCKRINKKEILKISKSKKNKIRALLLLINIRFYNFVLKKAKKGR